MATSDKDQICKREKPGQACAFPIWLASVLGVFIMALHLCRFHPCCYLSSGTASEEWCFDSLRNSCQNFVILEIWNMRKIKVNSVPIPAIIPDQILTISSHWLCTLLYDLQYSHVERLPQTPLLNTRSHHLLHHHSLHHHLLHSQSP